MQELVHVETSGGVCDETEKNRLSNLIKCMKFKAIKIKKFLNFAPTQVGARRFI